MTKFGKLTVSTYRSFLTNKRTNLIVSYGKCGYPDYREAQIRIVNGKFSYIVTDGYKYLTIEKGEYTNLKSLLNIIEGNICPKPWYAK